MRAVRDLVVQRHVAVVFVVPACQNHKNSWLNFVAFVNTVALYLKVLTHDSLALGCASRVSGR